MDALATVIFVRDIYDWLALGCNVSLAIIGIVGVTVAVVTLRKIERQTSATENSVEIATNAQRGWLVEKGVDKPDLTGVWILAVICRFEVIGISPIKICESKFRFHLVNGRRNSSDTGSVPDLPEEPEYGSPETLVESPDMGSVMAPGATITVKPQFEETFLKPEDAASIENGEKFLCLYGFVKYRDSFASSKIRETRLCYVCGQRHPLDGRKGEFVIGGPAAYNMAI